MSPRPYRRGQRQATTDQTRMRILAATRDLLVGNDGSAGFSIDAVAQQADVARMTVYYQFSSKAGLLEALFDDMARRGGMEQVAGAFHEADPGEALAAYIRVLARFYDTDRVIHRRIRGLAALDPDLARALQARNERRRHGLRVILGRLAEQYGKPDSDTLDEAVDTLHMLSSFESFDALAGDSRGAEAAINIVLRLARAALNLDIAG